MKKYLGILPGCKPKVHWKNNFSLQPNRNLPMSVKSPFFSAIIAMPNTALFIGIGAFTSGVYRALIAAGCPSAVRHTGMMT
jgi:hypothetical protein